LLFKYFIDKGIPIKNEIRNTVLSILFSMPSNKNNDATNNEIVVIIAIANAETNDRKNLFI